MRIVANGLSFNSTVDGEPGAPWLVFSNPLATNLSLWDAQVEALKQSFQILRYDQRGHGATTAPGGGYTFDLLMKDAVALLDALKIEQAHFVGISMGGITALGLAEQHADRLASLVVCDAQSVAPSAAREEWGKRIRAAEQKGMEALVEPTIRRWFHPNFVEANPPALDKVREMIRTTPIRGFVGCAHALQQFDFGSALPEIDVPTLFMTGAQDGILPSKMREMHQRVQASTFVELDPAGHLSNIEQPEAFNRALQNFLRAK